MTKQTETALDFRGFLRGLSSVQQDRFVRVMNELQRQGRNEEIRKLEDRLLEVKKDLSRIETQRNQIKAWCSEISSVLADVEIAIAAGNDPVLLQLRILLRGLYVEAESRLAESKPVALLGEKAELKKMIAKRRDLAALAVDLGERVKACHGD